MKPATGANDNAHDGPSALSEAQHLSEAESIAVANRTSVPRVLRKIANRHIAQHYPTMVAVGLEPRLEARGDADIWILPLVYASPGYGDHGIVAMSVPSRSTLVQEVLLK